MSTEATTSPEAAINPLCASDSVSDVISAAQNALRFLVDAKGSHDDEQDRDFLDGRQWLYAMVHDALGYAHELTEAHDREARRS